jgi:thiazolinyl imide reductase
MTRRVLVCGTRFGQAYLAALLDEPAGCRPAGILARGSARSQRLAAALGVPLYRRIEELPARLEIACVALRSRAFGGPGTDLAKALLARGLHVLQEHPVTAGEIADLIRTARAAGVCYQVSSGYGHGPAARAFIDYLRRWPAERRPHYLALTTSSQLLFSSLDILGRVLGGLDDLAVAGPAAWPDEAVGAAALGAEPFRLLLGQLRGVPLTLQLQAYLDPRDPDHHSLVQHRIVAGAPEGSLELCSSFGPVVWSRAVHLPDYADDAAGAAFLGGAGTRAADPALGRPCVLTLAEPDATTLAAILAEAYPAMIAGSLAELVAAIEGGPAAAPFQTEGYLQDLARAWQTVLRQAGPLTELALAPPAAPVPDPLAFREELRHG